MDKVFKTLVKMLSSKMGAFEIEKKFFIELEKNFFDTGPGKIDGEKWAGMVDYFYEEILPVVTTEEKKREAAEDEAYWASPEGQKESALLEEMERKDDEAFRS